jgi:hypothetical protein
MLCNIIRLKDAQTDTVAFRGAAGIIRGLLTTQICG